MSVETVITLTPLTSTLTVGSAEFRGPALREEPELAPLGCRFTNGSQHLFEFPPHRQLVFARNYEAHSEARLGGTKLRDPQSFAIPLPWTVMLMGGMRIWLFARPAPLIALTDPLYYTHLTNWHEDGTPCTGNLSAIASLSPSEQIPHLFTGVFNNGMYYDRTKLPTETWPMLQLTPQHAKMHGMRPWTRGGGHSGLDVEHYYAQLEKHTPEELCHWSWVEHPTTAAKILSQTAIPVFDRLSQRIRNL